MANNEIRTGVDYNSLLNKAAAESQLINVEVHHVGPMSILAPDAHWQGTITITGENALTPEQDALYIQSIKESIVALQPGGQRACMDGRELEGVQLAPGPKTAGGTQGDAARVMLASIAAGAPKSYDESLNFVMTVDQKLGYASGGHELTQCGAFKFAPDAITDIVENPELTAEAVKTFFGAVGLEYSQEAMDKVIAAASTISEDSLPSPEHATHQVTNEHSNPTLSRGHLENDILVFLRDDVTLDNNKQIALTNERLGKEVQAFGYNLAHHAAIAKELGSEEGQLYLHAVAAMDVHTLTKLTDGTVRITAVQ